MRQSEEVKHRIPNPGAVSSNLAGDTTDFNDLAASNVSAYLTIVSDSTARRFPRTALLGCGYGLCSL